jgi:predicted RNase H-like HicB family nuclease
MEYTILVHKAQEDVYWAEVPALPGCYSKGETIEETIENIKETIKSRLIAFKEYENIPEDEDFVIAKVNVTGCATA